MKFQGPAFLVALSLSFPAAARAKVITAVERLDGGPLPLVHYDPTYPTFAPATQIWSDYTFLWHETPSYLRGSDQVLTSLNQDTDDPDFRLRLSLSQDAAVYLLIDGRIPSVAAQMPWVSQLGFSDTGDLAVMDLAGRLVGASIYRAAIPAGGLVLLQQNTSPDDAFMYTVAAAPLPEPQTVLFGAVAIFLAVTRRQRVGVRHGVQTENAEKIRY